MSIYSISSRISSIVLVFYILFHEDVSDQALERSFFSLSLVGWVVIKGGLAFSIFISSEGSVLHLYIYLYIYIYIYIYTCMFVYHMLNPFSMYVRYN